MAAVDYFLKMDGIEGESQDARHKNEIDIESFSWGETNTGAAHTGSGAGAGKVNMQDFHFVMPFNKASPKLFLACASGEHIKQAVLSARKSGNDQQDFLTWTLSDCVVASYDTGANTTTVTRDDSSDGDPSPEVTASRNERSGMPADEFSLAFGRIEVAYRPQGADGSAGSEVRAGWDLKQNKKV